MSRYRSRLEIVGEMLHAVHDGSDKPTGIFYAANLSYRSGKDVLHLLVQNDLLREREIPGKKKTKKRYSVNQIRSTNARKSSVSHNRLPGKKQTVMPTEINSPTLCNPRSRESWRFASLQRKCHIENWGWPSALVWQKRPEW